MVVASRDRRHRTRRAERRGRSVAFSAAGSTCRRPGHEDRFPRARLLVRRRRAAQTPRGQRRKRLFAPGRKTAAPRLSDLPDDLSGSPSRVRRCRSQLAATNGPPATALSARITEFLQVLAFPTTDPPQRAYGWS